MPICIECRYPVPQLYHVLHSTTKASASATTTTATTPSLPSTNLNGKTKTITKAINGGTRPGGESAVKSAGGDVRLTQCPRCKRFADKYVEHDFVVIFIDLVLVKPQVRPLFLHPPHHPIPSSLASPPLSPPHLIPLSHPPLSSKTIQP